MKFSSKLGVAWLALQFALPALADPVSETRAAYLAVIDRPRVALQPELAELPPVEGLKKYHLWFSADADERVPGYLLLPDSKAFKGRRPVVIALHGTGGNKDNMGDFLLKAAKAGFIGVAIDGRHHGERTRAGQGAEEYNAAIFEAFKSGRGHPFYYDTSWDVMRLVDYLVTRKDVDAARIGLSGVSKGGIETYLAAAADPRIAAAVPYIGVQSFKWALENGQWRARIATMPLLVCVLLLTAVAWSWPAGLALVTVGSLILVLRARAAALPLDASRWMLVLAVPVGTGLFLALWSGGHPLAVPAGVARAVLKFSAALARFGRWLTRETPLDVRILGP